MLRSTRRDVLFACVEALNEDPVVLRSDMRDVRLPTGVNGWTNILS